MLNTLIIAVKIIKTDQLRYDTESLLDGENPISFGLGCTQYKNHEIFHISYFSTTKFYLIENFKCWFKIINIVRDIQAVGERIHYCSCNTDYIGRSEITVET